MEYLLIDFDKDKNSFVSIEGEEPSLMMEKEDAYEYYLHKSRKFVVKLFNGWVGREEKIGKIVDIAGNMISIIPNPGISHGEFSIGGLVAGNEDSFKFVVIPQGNSQEYYLKYIISEGVFEEAGLQVR